MFLIYGRGCEGAELDDLCLGVRQKGLVNDTEYLQGNFVIF